MKVRIAQVPNKFAGGGNIEDDPDTPINNTLNTVNVYPTKIPGFQKWWNKTFRSKEGYYDWADRYAERHPQDTNTIIVNPEEHTIINQKDLIADNAKALSESGMLPPLWDRNLTVGANEERLIQGQKNVRENALRSQALQVAENAEKGLFPVYDDESNIAQYLPYNIALDSNDKPLSGTDPVGEFYVSTVTLNPIFKGIGKAGKQLLGGNTGKALSQGIRKVTANDGKIFLRLPSHSKKMPRQLRIEPQGDNAFRVHISTWGGITDAEKKELYDALYNTLPENAKILFPESSADYLATRGTVAGLRRLERDPRFTPGKTKQTLMYRDKDGNIKTFEGTDFVKSPNYKTWAPEQWTAAQDAAIARGDMAEAQRLRDLHFMIKAPYNKLVNGDKPIDL